MNITLSKLSINTRLSEETVCFSADIKLDGRKVGDASNRGHGGPTDVHWDDVEAGKQIATYAATKYPDSKFVSAVESLIDDMVFDAQEEKQYRRWCKTKTVFRLKGDKEGEWRTFNVVYNKTVHRPQLEKRYPNLEEVLNERFA